MLRVITDNTLLKLAFAASVAILSSFLPFYFGGIWSDFQFILLPAFTFSFFLFVLLRSNREQWILSKIDIGWAVFLILGFVSSIWSTNISQVWPQAFGWLGLLSIVFCLKSKVFTSAHFNLLANVGILLFAFVSLLHIYAICLELLSRDFVWNSVFGRNANYTSTYLVAFFSFVLFKEAASLRIRILKVISGLFVAFVLYWTTSKGAACGMLLLFLLQFYKTISKYKYYFLGLLGPVAVVGVVLLLPRVESMIDSQSTRIYMLKSSYLLWLDKPLLGYGMGNWFNNAYRYDLTDIELFNNAHHWFRHHSHNLYGRLVVEVGAVGLLSFLFPIGVILKSTLSSYADLTQTERALLGSLLVYLVASLFYNVVGFLPFEWSGIGFMAFCAIGILGRRTGCGVRVRSIYLICGLFLSFLTISWGGYMAYKNNQFHRAKSAQEKGNIDLALKLYNELYQPYLFTQRNHKELIPLKLGKLYEEKEDSDLAVESYEAALKLSPYNGEVLYQLALLNMFPKEDLLRAKELFLRIDEIQKNRINVNFYLGEIEVKLGDKTKALEYLSRVEKSIYKSRIASLRNGIEKLEELDL